MATLTNAAIEAGLNQHKAWQRRDLAPSHGPGIAFSPKFIMAPNWASGEKQVAPILDRPTHFEQMVEQIGVTPQFYEFSQPLKDWVRKYRYTRYVPEWLLAKWGMEVNADDVSWTL